MAVRPEDLSILNYTYDLTSEKIALIPAAQRHDSKLLVYKDEQINESTYRHLHEFLPADSLIFFNNTKVIKARLRFKKSSGGVIEIFCLEPTVFKGYENNLAQQGSSRWNCFVGGASKWKDETLQMPFENGILFASLHGRSGEMYVVEFSWTPEQLTFSEVIDAAGKIPLPPYIKRDTDEQDTSRYQTLFALHEGSVAAPTAGLHFTEEVLSSLDKKNIQQKYLTLHVGAGTFKPVKAEKMSGHEMHAEWIDIQKEIIETLMLQDEPVIATGTTSLRTLESLYWLGVKAFVKPDAKTLELSQWELYNELPRHLSKKEAMHFLLQWMNASNIDRLVTKTQLLIAPGYTFKIADILITNFHQPQSTLLLLVAAAIGDNWRKVYDYALTNSFRFLSYGDGSVLYIKKNA